MTQALLKDKEANFLQSFDLTEIINGEKIMAPSPFAKHQLIVARLYNVFYKFVSEKKIGEVFISPLDVIFEEGVNRLQPDLIFVRKENTGIIQDWIRGAPDLVVEVISENSLTLDTVIKKEIYERYGVKEFWLAFPQEMAVQIYALEGGRYRLLSFAEQSGSVKSKIIEGLEVNINEVFQE